MRTFWWLQVAAVAVVRSVVQSAAAAAAADFKSSPRKVSCYKLTQSQSEQVEQVVMVLHHQVAQMDQIHLLEL
jgi:hypothetical protein